MANTNNVSNSFSNENRKVVVSLILGYDLLHHQDIKSAFFANLCKQSHGSLPKLTRGCWDIVLVLCEAHLTNTSNVVTDVCTMSCLSESTTRRSLKKLQKLEIIERYDDLNDRRRQFVSLTPSYKELVNQFVNKCAQDFKELIELNDKRERIRAIESWLRAETRLQLVVDSVPALISYIDSGHRYVFNNSKYLEWFGDEIKNLTGKHIRSVIGEATYKAMLPYIRKALGGEALRFELELLLHKKQQSRDVLVNYIPDIDDTGKVLGFIEHIIDITGQKKVT